MQQTNRVSLFGGGLNSDDSRDIMPQADGRERWNIAYGEEGQSQDIVAVNGHVPIDLFAVFNDPVGEELGSCKDIESGLLYYAVNVTSNNVSKIIEVNPVNGSNAVVMSDLPYGGDFFRILNFPVGGKVSMGVLDGKLFFTDGVNEPRKLNIARAKIYSSFSTIYTSNLAYYIPNTVNWTCNAPILYHVNGYGTVANPTISTSVSYSVGKVYTPVPNDFYNDSYFFSPFFTGNQSSWNKDQLSQIKPPLKNTLVADYSNISGFIGNFVTGKAFKFSVKLIYKDYEQSVWSIPSNIPLDKTIDSTGEASDVYNCIKLSIPMPNPDVKIIRIACCDAVNDIWYQVEDIDVKTFNGLPSYDYIFYGTKLGDNIPLEEINEAYHYVPIKSKSLEIAEGRIIHANIVTDRPNHNVTINVTPDETNAGSSSSYVELEGAFQIQNASNYSTATKTLRNFKYKISAPNGWSAIPPLGSLSLYTTTLYQGTTYIDQVNSDGVKTVTQLLLDFISIKNAKPYSKVNESGMIRLFDNQLFITDNIDGTKNICFVYALRYYLEHDDHGLDGWNLSAGNFDTISDNEFFNSITGHDAYDFMTPTYQNQLSAGYIVQDYFFHVGLSVESFSKGNVLPSYKGGSAISVGIGYFDHAMRYSTLIDSKDVFIPNRTDENKRWRLKVDITGNVPDYAEKYSIFQTESNIQDVTQVVFNPKGECFLGGITGDAQTINNEPSRSIENIYITGITGTNSDNGILYWELDYSDGVPRIIIWADTARTREVAATIREKHHTGFLGTGGNDWSIPGVYGSGEWQGGIDLTKATAEQINYLVTGGVSGAAFGTSSSVKKEGVVKIYQDTDRRRSLLRVKIVSKNNSGISGWVDIKTHLTTLPFAPTTRKIISELYQGVKLAGNDYSQDEIDRYRFNIASYLNVLKKYNVIGGYNPEVGDYVRVVKTVSGMNNDNVLLKITKMGEIMTSDDGYFQYAYIYTEKDTRTSVYDFSNGGIIELLKVNQVKQTIFYSETKLRGYNVVGGVKQHECDLVNLDGSQTIFVDSGSAYVRPRFLVKPNGEVDPFSYFVEDYRISDTFQSKTFSKGRLNVIDKSSRVLNFPTMIRHGGRLLNETTVNNTCNYKYSDLAQLDEKNGDITRMVVHGDVMRVFQRNNIPSIYLGKAEMKMADGNSQWVVSDKFLAQVRPSTSMEGSTHYDSILNINGNIYFWDQNLASPCKSTGGGTFKLAGKVSEGVNATDMKMFTFFKLMASKLSLNSKNKVVTSYSNRYGLVLFSFIFFNEDGVITSDSLTVSLHENTNRWFSKYKFVILSSDQIERNTYSIAFDISETPTLLPKLMDLFASSDRCNFGGIGLDRIGDTAAKDGVIEVNINEPKRLRKNYEGILLDMDFGDNYINNATKSTVLEFYTPTSATYKEQGAYLNQYQLHKEESHYVSDIPKDKNSFSGKPDAFNMKLGNELVGTYCTVKLTLPKVIYGNSYPDYSIREIDLNYSTFK